MDTFVDIPTVSQTEALRQRFVKYCREEAAKARRLHALEKHKPSKVELDIRARTFEEVVSVWSTLLLTAPPPQNNDKPQRVLNGRRLAAGENNEHRLEFVVVDSRRHYKTLCGQVVASRDVQLIVGSELPSCPACRAASKGGSLFS